MVSHGIMANCIDIFTGISCKTNPGPAGYAALLRNGTAQKVVSRVSSQATNHAAELSAVLVGLREIKVSNIPVVVHSRNEYICNILSGKSQASANRALVDMVFAEIKRFTSVNVVHAAADNLSELEAAHYMARIALGMKSEHNELSGQDAGKGRGAYACKSKTSLTDEMRMFD